MSELPHPVAIESCKQTNVKPTIGRIEYIDALRGFTMVLVIVAHAFTFSEVSSIYWCDFFQLFRMPLFFFISGFILYKNDYKWNRLTLLGFLKKKFVIQIIPTIIFLGLYNFIFSLSSIDYMYNGYWFTIALFVYFVIYSITRFLFGNNEKISLLFLLLMGVVSYVVSMRSFPYSWCYYITGHIGYFLFFSCGVVAKKYFMHLCKIMNNINIMAVIVALFIILSILFLNGYLDLPIKLIVILAGIISIFYFFAKNELLIRNTIIGKCLQFIGKRTLDIYLLHYFFIKGVLNWVEKFSIDQPIILFMISILVSILVIVVCLIISKFIRTNCLLGKLLFGAKC